MRSVVIGSIIGIVGILGAITVYLAPGALASTETEKVDPTPLMAAYNCNAEDLSAVLGEGFSMHGEPALYEWPYNSRGWYITYVSYWVSGETENNGERVFTCLTVLYDNWASAHFENTHHSLRQWVEQDYDMEEFKVYDPPAIGDGFRAAGYRHTITVREDYPDFTPIDLRGPRRTTGAEGWRSTSTHTKLR